MLAIFILVMANVVDMVSFCFLVEGGLSPGERACTLPGCQSIPVSILFRLMTLDTEQVEKVFCGYSEIFPTLAQFFVAPSTLKPSMVQWAQSLARCTDICSFT